MMVFAFANVPQAYAECDHNVMRLAPLHGCRARSARCADKQRTIGDAVDGCFDPTRKVMSGTHALSEKVGTGFRKRSHANKSWSGGASTKNHPALASAHRGVDLEAERRRERCAAQRRA